MAGLPSLERTLKTLHSWLGVLLLPWVIIIGLTGICLNHWRVVDAFLESPAYDERAFDDSPAPGLHAETELRALAKSLWPGKPIRKVRQEEYHGRNVWRLQSRAHSLILDTKTGHYWVKTRYTRKTYAPDGTLLHRKIYWGQFVSSLHENGWVNSRFGSWLADLTGAAMALFGLSGLYLFTAPRLRRRRNRKARLRAASAS